MNRQQFITKVEGCQKSVRRFLAALCCGDIHTADDIAQETFIKAWLSCDKIRNDSSFDTWIRKIAYNTFINYQRSSDTSPCSLDDSTVQTLTSESTGDSSFRYQELYQALFMLSAKERTSIVLFYLDGYSINEIAKIEETTSEAIKQHLSRGRIHLRSLLTSNSLS